MFTEKLQALTYATKECDGGTAVCHTMIERIERRTTPFPVL